MNELELAEYCRKKELYREQIEAWRNVCLQANGQAFDQAKQLNGALKEEQKRAKQLEKELQKKEKALAEAAALLLLRKKPKRFGGTTRTNDWSIQSRISYRTHSRSQSAPTYETSYT
ncbi:transposase [Lysinibacillus macroides]|uniref:transposase n=1 Tax=Lysinibacillus macroides TaxID=33935 RepID=UPI000AD64D57|nr:transposase [Lysinibacillus macroides]